MKEDWTKQLRERLEGHQMTPPSGLWEDISREMGLEPTPKPAIMRRWYWAAVAAILALVGFFAIYDYDDNAPQSVVGNKVVSQEKPIASAPAEEPSEETPVDNQPAISSKPSLLAQAPIVEEVKPDLQQKSEEIIQEELAETVQQDTTDTKTLASKEKKQIVTLETPVTDAAEYQSDNSNKWTFGLSGSNGILIAANTMKNQSVHYGVSGVVPQNYTENGLAGITQSYQLIETVVKHHIPVRFGLSMQYQLNNRIALISGINYTYLKSEFNIPQYKNFGYSQKLRYLGIPLGLYWKIWSTGNFHFYLSGGAMIEKCISSEVSSGEINKHPWQWSVNGSVGAEYNIIRQFGIYLEPSLGYFFDDGTSLQHYYKEHPLAPSVQFGLRYHLK